MILALDVGGSKIAVGLVKNNKIFYFQKFNWPRGKVTRQKFLRQLISLIRNLKLEIRNFTAIAVSIAGQVNRSGEVIISRNIIKKKTKIELKKTLEKKFKLPVFIENDANCFTLAEAIYGQGKNKKYVVGLTLGTGIGGGIVIEQKIFHGADGFAGEFGHMVIEANKEKCSCGKKGCFETMASVTALKKNYFKLTGKKIHGFMINQAFQKKDKKAISATNQLAHYLAIGLANIINIFNPDVIVLGGGLSCFKELIKMAVEKALKHTLIPSNQTKILVSRLGEHAQLLGAALLIKQSTQKYALAKKRS